VINEQLIHTGQHYDYEMSEIFFKEMGIREPDHNLGIGSASHAEQTGRMMMALEKSIAQIAPNLVMVYGDTNSTLAGALTAVKMHIPVAHVEAGLRSKNRAMSEEINRILTDHISDILFCPTGGAVQALSQEGITEGVHMVGDVMYDALLYHLPQARNSKILEQLNLQKGEYALATVHRAANTDNPKNMQALLAAFGMLSTPIVLPLHPRTQKLLAEFGFSVPPNVSQVEPVGYLDILALEENANCVLTDSGGMQKEAYWLGVRCITLRNETEWVETVDAGWNTLVGVDLEMICNTFDTWSPKGKRPPIYVDGHAAEVIRDIIARNIYTQEK